LIPRIKQGKKMMSQTAFLGMRPPGVGRVLGKGAVSKWTQLIISTGQGLGEKNLLPPIHFLDKGYNIIIYEYYE
jgi:hypothetical protein